MLKLHYLQHVPFEDLASIEKWALDRQHRVSCTRWFLDESPPDLSEFDWLIVMGEPMNIYEYESYPWLKDEKAFIRQAIDADKPVLGICLGAQLVADVLGGKITKNAHKEIGWYPVHKSEDIRGSSLDEVFPDSVEVYHWHGDTFSLPPSCHCISGSAACLNQGFIYREKVIGLQFHLETTPESASALIDNCGDELTGDDYIQSGDEMLSNKARFENINKLMNKLLDHMSSLTAVN